MLEEKNAWRFINIFCQKELYSAFLLTVHLQFTILGNGIKKSSAKRDGVFLLLDLLQKLEISRISSPNSERNGVWTCKL